MKPVTNSETYLKPLRLRKYLQYTGRVYARPEYRANYWATLCSSVIMTVISGPSGEQFTSIQLRLLGCESAWL